MNNKNILNKNTENFTSTKLDWSIIQAEMKNKLGSDVYESWLKKISFVEELKLRITISINKIYQRLDYFKIFGSDITD